MDFDTFSKGPDSDENIYSLNDRAFPLENLRENIALGRITISSCVCHVALLFEWFFLLFYLRHVHVAENQELSYQPFPVSSVGNFAWF